MNDRFKFNAVVSSYYDIDTPENYEEFEPQFYLKNVDVFCTREIGVDYDDLLNAVREQSKGISEKEIGQIMQHFEDNSNSPDSDFVTITPDKILQSTGLKDKNGKLVYEGDILGGIYGNLYIHWCDKCKQFQLKAQDYGCMACEGDIHWCEVVEDNNKLEIVGNIYENPELLEVSE